MAEPVRWTLKRFVGIVPVQLSMLWLFVCEAETEAVPAGLSVTEMPLMHVAAGGVPSCTEKTTECVAVWPLASVAVKMIVCAPTANVWLKGVFVIVKSAPVAQSETYGEMLKLTGASHVVAFGAVKIVCELGVSNAKTGFCESLTVIVWLAVEVFKLSSVAVHVRVIV